MSTFSKRVLMIEPSGFKLNLQTVHDNKFQQTALDLDEVREKAGKEFNGLKNLLLENRIGAEIIKITDTLDTPDAVFPNNWFSTHENGTLVLYPMMAPNRRLERRPEIVKALLARYPIHVDLSRSEERGLYLEGTGSIVIDNKNKKAYASLSERTSSNLLYEWSKLMNIETINFDAYDEQGNPIYHTNVLLTIGNGFCILCTASLRDLNELRLIRKSLTEGGLEIIDISYEQMNNFCGNCLQLVNESEESYLVMSTRAFNAFTSEQKVQIEKFTKIIHTPLDMIESQGGGSARCMMAELF